MAMKAQMSNSVRRSEKRLVRDMRVVMRSSGSSRQHHFDVRDFVALFSMREITSPTRRGAGSPVLKKSVFFASHVLSYFYWNLTF
jgi:hypothetical protein